MIRVGSIVHYAEIWGLKEGKYKWLESRNLKNTRWEDLSPAKPFYFFVPIENKHWGTYEKFWKIADIFPVNSVGVVTARDSLTIQRTPNDVWVTVLNFSKMDSEQARAAYGLGKDARDWKVSLAQEDLTKSGPRKEYIVPILYRPFDIRYTYYTGRSRGFLCMPRPGVMQHMQRPNLALITARRNRLANVDSFLCSDKLVETKCGESTIQSYTFPLYLYNDNKKGHQITLLSQNEYFPANKKPNIKEELLALLNNTYNQQSVATPLGQQESFNVTPEEIFSYIYAILYSNIYRSKYLEFLKIDFPRIPFTKDYKLFKKLADLGQQLVDLHLLKSPELNNPIAKFYGQDDSYVKKREYEEKEQRVYINELQYFSGVASKVWNYQIGGYQVLDKWLKDRKGRTLSAEDVKHYCQVATALSKTIEVQKEIDKLYPGVERTLLA